MTTGRSNEEQEDMTVVVVPARLNAPRGKLADIELHFGAGPLAGLQLVGFTVWARRGDQSPAVTFPCRNYAVNGERRTFALLRAFDRSDAERIRELIVAAYNAQAAAKGDIAAR